MECCLGGCCLAGLGAWARCHLRATGIWRERPRGPLVGVRILDLSQGLSGPYASKLLADMGAEVIKVENLTEPDPVRAMGHSPVQGMAGSFMTANAGKRSLALDMEKGGAAVILKLAEGADVLLQSLAPAAAERMGVDYKAVQAASPDIVYCSISALGPDGPRADAKTCGPLVQCLTGLCLEQADEYGPKLVPGALAEKLTGLTVAQAVVAALVARDRGAGGQRVEVSVLESVLQWLWPDNYCNNLWQVPCPEGLPPAHLFYRMFATRDTGVDGERPGKHVALGAAADEDWLALCHALQRPDLAGDIRFATASDRADNLADWVREVQSSMSALTSEEALAALEREGVPYAESSSLEEVTGDVQSARAVLFLSMRHALFGTFRQVRFPAEFGETHPSGPSRSPAPLPGEHSAKLLAEAGYTEQKVAELMASGAVLNAAAAMEETGVGGKRQLRAVRLLESLQRLDSSNFWAAPGPPLSKVAAAEAHDAVAMMRDDGPFAGLQVLEVGRGLEVALAGAILADQGADVTKVELLRGLDPARSQGPAPAAGMAAVHMAANRGKRSVVVDINSERATEVIGRLAAEVDAIVVGLGPEEASQLGLSFWELRPKNRGLVFVSVSGFDSRGPRYWEPDHDCLVQALAGTTATNLNCQGDPTLVNSHLADKVTALFIALALGAACRMQLRGVVQQVEVDKFSCTVNFNFLDHFANSVWEAIDPKSPGAVPETPPPSAFCKLVETRDGPSALCMAVVSDAEFQGACKALGHPEWLENEAWRTLPGRLRDAAKLSAALNTAVKAMDTASVLARCKEHGVPCAAVQTVEECLQDPQALHCGVLESARHPVLGEYRLPRHAARFSATPANGRTPAPAPGEGMVEHLEACGYDRDDIMELVAAGALAAPVRLEPAASWGSYLLSWVAAEERTVDEAWKQQAHFKAAALQTLRPAATMRVTRSASALPGAGLVRHLTTAPSATPGLRRVLSWA